MPSSNIYYGKVSVIPVHDISSKDTSSNTTFRRMDTWSKWFLGYDTWSKNILNFNIFHGATFRRINIPALLAVCLITSLTFCIWQPNIYCKTRVFFFCELLFCIVLCIIYCRRPYIVNKIELSRVRLSLSCRWFAVWQFCWFVWFPNLTCPKIAWLHIVLGAVTRLYVWRVHSKR